MLCPSDCIFFPILVKGRTEPGSHMHKHVETGRDEIKAKDGKQVILGKTNHLENEVWITIMMTSVLSWEGEDKRNQHKKKTSNG